MSVVPILHVPDPVLRKVATPVESVDKKVREYALNLVDTLQSQMDPQGVGLAAPQIGRTYRMFATQLDDEKNPDKLVRKLFVNPKFIDMADKKTVGVNPRNPDLEGCLSIPALYGPVSRPEWVTCTWQEIGADGQLTDWHTQTFFDFPARVLQHELDHLNGVLFTDHILEQGQRIYRMQNEDLIEIDPSAIEKWSQELS